MGDAAPQSLPNLSLESANHAHSFSFLSLDDIVFIALFSSCTTLRVGNEKNRCRALEDGGGNISSKEVGRIGREGLRGVFMAG